MRKNIKLISAALFIILPSILFGSNDLGPYESSKFYVTEGLSCLILNGQKDIEYLVMIKSESGDVKFSVNSSPSATEVPRWEFVSKTGKKLGLYCSKNDIDPDGLKHNVFKIYAESSSGNWIQLESDEFIYSSREELKLLVDKLVDITK
jgi:hypothetical protein